MTRTKIDLKGKDPTFETLDIILDPQCCDNSQHAANCPVSYRCVPIRTKLKCVSCGKHRKEMYYAGTQRDIAIIRCFFCVLLYYTDGLSIATRPNRDELIARDVKKVVCDGGLVAMNKYGGTWAWTGVNDLNRRIIGESGFVEGPPSKQPDKSFTRHVTNNHSEQIAIVKALESMPDGWEGTVISDSRIALGRVFNRHTWSMKNLPPNILERTHAAMTRMGPGIKSLNIQGHPTEDDIRKGWGRHRNLPVLIHNVYVDWECERQREEYFKVYDLDGNYMA